VVQQNFAGEFLLQGEFLLSRECAQLVCALKERRNQSTPPPADLRVGFLQDYSVSQSLRHENSPASSPGAATARYIGEACDFGFYVVELSVGFVSLPAADFCAGSSACGTQG
jgi:hypothetical protein